MTVPVRYGEHASVEPGTPCVICRDTPERPVTDHCHEHGWVRGVICMRCNANMAYIDRRITPRAILLAGLVALADLIAHARRCPDCPPLDADDIGPTASLRPTVPSPEKPTTVRFTPDLNAAIRRFADDMGISFNAALSVLAAEALTARGRHPRADKA